MPKRFFRLSYYELPQAIDTSRLGSISEYYLAANLGGTLVVLGAADQYYSCLARRWEVDRTKNTLTFTLDPRAHFSNGDPITTEDVVSTFKRLALNGSFHFAVRELLLGADRLQRMEDPFPGVVALDAAQVRFTFHQLSPLSLYLFTMADTSILHRSQVEGARLAVDNWAVSSGAYSVAAWEPGKLRLRKNPHFPLIEPTSLEELELVEVRERDKLIEGLVSGGLQYTLESFLTTEAGYDKLLASPSIEIRPRSYCATMFLFLFPRLELMQSKANRQALYRQLYQAKLDLRPLKNEWFSPAYHLYLPTQLGKPSQEEVETLLATFPSEPPRALRDNRFEYLYMPWLFDDRSGNILIEFMQKFGFVANANRFVSNEDWVARKPKYLFFGSPLYIDERELHETFSYMLSVGLYFKENAEKVRALNLRLAAEQDDFKRAALTKEIGLLLVDDALVFPLYHVIRQDFLHREYEFSAVNGFHGTPTLWRLRKRAPQP
ncbi:MAG: hypothetical protein A2284_16175 [Deltaproteobacteria bacterium RIFOXYA12_FULL_61_11]|nr:MAG: hypothetical protein A2284_16175 [Deltaproteobacteria bacterium RIFOXYA12_FULL_61_11]